MWLRWFISVLVAAGVAGVAILDTTVGWSVVHDSLPFAARDNFAAHWGSIVSGVGRACALLIAGCTLFFLVGARSAPVLVRRVGAVFLLVSALTTGLAAVVLLVPHHTVHPGRMPAGDVAGGLLALVLVAGSFVVGLLGAACWIMGWGWARRRLRSDTSRKETL